MKYTPGPWAPYWESVKSTSADIVVASDPNDRICTTCAGNEGEVEIANAHLIAAAPDLLEALAEGFDKVGAIVGDFSPEHDPHNYTPVLNDCLLRLKQWLGDAEIAIAKARGEK